MRTAAPRMGTAVSGRAGSGSAHLVAGRAQVLAGDDYPVGHAGLGRLAPRARVVELLVSDLAVDLQYGIVVAEHMVGDRAGVGVLRVGVDVHLHHAVVPVSYTHLRAHETDSYLVCRLLLEKKKK